MTSGFRFPATRFNHLALLLLIFVSVSPATAETCLEFEFPIFGGTTGDGLGLDGVEHEDLQVSIGWGDDGLPDANLVLSTPAGVDLETWPVARDPGERTEHLLESALVHVATANAGFQFRLRLEDAEGPRDEVRFRVGVTCPTGENCRYRLIEGLEGGPIAVSEEFWNAVAWAKASGSSDLIETVRTKFPDLTDEIPGFVWELTLGEQQGNADCTCRWVDAVGLSTPAIEIGDKSGQQPLHVLVENPEGAFFAAGAQSIDGPTGASRFVTQGRSALGIWLLCTTTTGGDDIQLPTDWPSRPVLWLEEPTLDPCGVECMPTIEHVGRIAGCAQSIAAGNGLWAQSAAEVDGSLVLNSSQSLIAGAATVQVDAPGTTVGDNIDHFDQTSTMTLVAPGAVAEVAGSGKVSVQATDASNGHGYSYAGSAMDFHLRFTAQASCEGIGPHDADLGNLLDGADGGVAIERWEDP